MRPLVLLPLLAAFFVRVPSTPSGLLRRQGGALVQESRVTVNGSEGTLSVFAFDTTADALVAALRPADSEKPLPAGLFVLPCGAAEAPQCLAFALDADSPGDPEWPWSDLPPANGFAPAFSATLNDGRTGFAAGSLGLAPDAARALWSSHLSANGWTAVSPAAETTGLSLYAKGSETLALTVLDAPDGASQVSLLRRAPRGSTP